MGEWWDELEIPEKNDHIHSCGWSGITDSKFFSVKNPYAKEEEDAYSRIHKIIK